MRVHAIEVGRIRFPRGWFDARTRRQIGRALLRGVGDARDEIPILSYLVEHDHGHIVIDTGFDHGVANRIGSHRFLKKVLGVSVGEQDVVSARMRARGLRPEDVRLVLPTHLDLDHAGAIAQFPNADVFVHRSEWDYRTTLIGRLRFQAGAWGEGFEPTIYDLVAEPFGSFERSYALPDYQDVVVVPTPGHTKGHVGVVMKNDGVSLFFGGDHLIRQSWFARDLANGVEPINFYQGLTRRTTARIRQFVEETPTILLPSHDADAAANLAALEPLEI